MYFPNCKYLLFLKLEVFGILQIDNFKNFQNRKFLEFFKLEFFLYFQNCEFLEFSKL